MEKVVRITTLHDRKTDYEYWMSKTPLERLAAIEFLRQQYIQSNSNVQSRLQRVCRIIEKKAEGIEINFISYNDLLKNKKANNRNQDKTDLENLTKQ